VIYYFVALVYDFSSSNKVKKFRDFLFTSLALPLAFKTSLMFWTITSIDRELGFPKEVDEFFPTWLDWMLHTNISIFVIFDILNCRHEFSSRKSSIRGLIIFMLCYLIFIYAGKINTGKFIYGVIEVLSAPQRIIFFVICGLVVLGLYFLGEILNKILTGRKNQSKGKKSK
jgi:hypothetical protein